MSIPSENTKDAAEIEAMFSRIAPRYDITNRVLSFGFDMSWRRTGIALASPADDANILDLGCGTGDMLAVILKRKAFHGHIVGLDLSQPMLDLAKVKLANLSTKGSYELRQGNALAVEDPNNTYDLITTCFGIRNFSDLAKGFEEASRLLKPRGRFLVIEFFALEHEPWYVRLYLKYILPIFGALLSGRRFAYSYLSRSKQKFLSADEFGRFGEKYGLSMAARKRLTFGVAEIIMFEKGDAR